MRREPTVLRQLPQMFEPLAGLVTTLVEGIAFWTTIAFPLVYVGGYVAVATLPEWSLPSASVFVALFGVNLLALVVGHRYNQSTEMRSTATQPAPTGRPQRGD